MTSPTTADLDRDSDMPIEVIPSTTPTNNSRSADPYPPPATPILPVLGTLPALPDFTEDEAKAWEVMSDPLRAKVLEIRQWLGDEPRLLLEHRYRLGKTIKEIQSTPDVYGHLSDLQLDAFFGDIGKTIYYEAKRIYERYPPDRFQQIIEARNPTNPQARIHYKHLALLLRVQDEAEADRMLDLCLAGGWTTRALERHISSAIETVNKTVRKSRRSQPSTFRGVLERLMSQSAVDVEEYEADLSSGAKIKESFQSVPDEAKTEELRERVSETKLALECAADVKLSLAKECERLLAAIEGVIAQRQQRKKGRRRSADIADVEVEPTPNDDEDL